MKRNIGLSCYTKPNNRAKPIRFTQQRTQGDNSNNNLQYQNSKKQALTPKKELPFRFHLSPFRFHFSVFTFHLEYRVAIQ